MLFAVLGTMSASAEDVLLPNEDAVKVAPIAPTEAKPEVSVEDLLQRASYWRQQGRPDLAKSLLVQVLKIEPDNPDALFQAGLVAIDEGETEEAEAYLARLAAAHPGNVRVERLKMAMARGQISPELIEQARAAAKAGDSAGAVKIYRDAFAGLPPPLEYAFEYYVAMAGTEEGWEEARRRLGTMAKENPGDLRIQLAYGRILTYREVTRREGIGILARLAPSSVEADRSWRDALTWLDASKADQALYDAYIAAHPDDGEVASRWAKVIEPMKPDTAEHAVTLAYAAVADRKYAEAEKLFLKALDFDPDNVNALTGMAGLRMQSGRAAEALKYMNRAIEIEPTLRTEYHDLYDAARFMNDYYAASGAAKRGRYSQAERLLRPLVAGKAKERSIAVALLASVLASQKKYAEAETYYRQALRLRPRDKNVITGLYRVLVARGKLAEANALADRVPSDIRADVAGDMARAEAAKAVSAAEARARAGDMPGAMAAYREAIGKAPDDPWARLAYARLLREQGRAADAEAVMQAVLDKPQPSAEALHAGALFALDRNRLQEAGALINAIPGPKRSAEIVTLSQEIVLKTTLREARQAAAAGEKSRALSALNTLAARKDLTPALWGEVASTMADMGEVNQAVAIARRELAKPVPAGASLSNYSALVAVMARYGSQSETEALVARLKPKARTAEEIRQFADLEAGLVAGRADALREQERYRAAYDLLMPPLGRDPENATLLGALARVYAASGNYDQAAGIYDRLLARAPGDEDLAMQAVWVAIGQSDYDRARQLLDPLLEQGTPSSQLYYANGLVLRAEGWNGAAIRALEKAKELRAQELGVGATTLGPPSASAGLYPPPALD
ncbi:tetratricopeptide repeat protein [Zavarzinia compransoris]|uniref:tetratricopeptide repeat protein n=1 Tax=Zavarzinia marina TaxID=2911065 RepID=UPI001F47551D|nr:tetratricopeptide repeat protein [Zavarzinia marina]MCF4164837.1 tetratricopeptide repeat protein [Zavarzinia marina]